VVDFKVPAGAEWQGEAVFAEVFHFMNLIHASRR
jgi:hypothetical protein